MFGSLSSNCPLPWEVLVLVADHLDPKTLAMASCVCKSWSVSMSSEHLWKPICTTHFPSISNLRAADPTVPYRRLYALGFESVRRRLRQPLKPRLSLADLIFTVDVVHRATSRVITIVKPGAKLEMDPNGLFRFDIEVEDEVNLVGLEDNHHLKLTWNVVLGGLKGVFTMMDVDYCKGKGKVKGEEEEWIMEDLPSVTTFYSGVITTTELIAELRLELGNNGGNMVIEKVCAGVLSVMCWRYARMDDVLRYLQHFLF